MTQQKKCAHPACDCLVNKGGEFGKYCSEHCKEAGQRIDLHCDCQHVACHLRVVTEPEPATPTVLPPAA